MSQQPLSASPHLSFDAATSFSPSNMAVREHQARTEADRIINEFVARFTEKDFFPEGGDGLLFGMLTQLSQWPADTSIRILDEDGNLLAVYMKGLDPSSIQRSVLLTINDKDEYVVADPAQLPEQEALFQLIFEQLEVGSALGYGGNFHGSISLAGRIVTVREQIVLLADANRHWLFEALMADTTNLRRDPSALPAYLDSLAYSAPAAPPDSLAYPARSDYPSAPAINPFLPFGLLQPANRSPVLSELLELHWGVPVARLEELLERFPLSSAEEDKFLETWLLPQAFSDALEASVNEWRSVRAIDGILHLRPYNDDSDRLAREITRQLMQAKIHRDLVVIEPGVRGYEPTGPDDNALVLWHDGLGNYLAENLREGEINGFKESGSDSFYRAVSSLLEPHERTLLGLSHELDLARLRQVVADIALQRNGGWFDLAGADPGKQQLLPDWLVNASESDRSCWNKAFNAYRQSLLEAQTPALLGVAQYGDRDEIRAYARARIQERFTSDLGLDLDPDHVVVETYHSDPVPFEGIGGEGYVDPAFPPVDITYTVRRRTLTDLCLENLSIIDIDFLLSARTVDNHGQVITALTARYVFTLVRELNVGENYVRFLTKTLLQSPSGDWYRERYAHVLQAQMRLDAIEAKMAGDFKPHWDYRAYRWIEAITEQPVDDMGQPKVDGHPVEVRQLRVNGVLLHGLLFVGSTSSSSVASVAMFSPLAPDHIAVREIEVKALRPALLQNPLFLDYLLGMADEEARPSLRHSLTATQYNFPIEYEPVEGNCFHTLYDNEARRAIRAADQQTTSNWEANWQSAWDLTKRIGELALEFAPFKVRLPVAALRSLYALSQGVRDSNNAPLHFTQALLLLTDGLPTSTRAKVTSRPHTGSLASTISPKAAVAHIPKGLTQRTDGVFKGVFEKANPGGQPTFYIQQDGRAYRVRYDTEFSTWRLIESGRPNAYYQQPIRFFEQRGWSHSQVGLAGGKPNKWERLKQQASHRPGKSNEGASDPAGSLMPVKPTTSSSRPGYTVNLEGFFDSPKFAKIQDKVPDNNLRAAVEKAVEKFHLDRAGHLHRSHAGRLSLDLPGVGGSTGRGAYRLLMVRGKQKGHLIPDAILDPHRRTRV